MKNFSFKKVRVRKILLISLTILSVWLLAHNFKEVRGAATTYKIHGNPNNSYALPYDHWAWNDIIEWIDFNFPQFSKLCSDGASSACVSSLEFQGQASSSYGQIYLNCADSPYSCSTSNFKIINYGGAILNGYAWNDAFGWFRFQGDSNQTPAVQIEPWNQEQPSSTFRYWAWNPVVGYVSFNCSDLYWTSSTPNAFCNATSSYKVATDWYPMPVTGWLESATFDTGITSGVQFNSISIKGAVPDGTFVKFQFAVSSDENGPWIFTGPSGTGSDYYSADQPDNPVDPNLFSVALDYSLYNNARYFRYKILLVSNATHTQVPTVNEVFVNWSP